MVGAHIICVKFRYISVIIRHRILTFLETGMILILFYVFVAIFIATAAVTLLGITKRISIDQEYLKPLFTALILEVVGAVIALFAGADFFGDTAAGFTSTLPVEVRSDTSDVSRTKIKDLVFQYQNLISTRSGLESDLAGCRVEIEKLKQALGEFDPLKGQVLVLFAQLNTDIAASTGEFINLSYKPDDKQKVASRIHRALIAINAIPGSSDPAPLKVHQALIDYQKRKQFPDVTGNFGRMTLISMINDYLENVRRGA